MNVRNMILGIRLRGSHTINPMKGIKLAAYGNPISDGILTLRSEEPMVLGIVSLEKFTDFTSAVRGDTWEGD